MNYYFFNLNKITNYLSVFEKLGIVFHFYFSIFQRFVEEIKVPQVEGTQLVGGGCSVGRVSEGQHG